ncbi:vWA domain-containing protein [Thalassotalea crassostreae]|uniref:vWA domain-containing protein n=1 Tax=Thalassotalea crassostreae TaxID=1763536 RepID=UPI00083963C5|nr:VWA domain-containing protein [Thalassotalea crassostreae]
MPNFEYPALLWLLILIPIFCLRNFKENSKVSSKHQYSNTELLTSLPKSSREKFLSFVPWLHIFALTGMIIAMAQPFVKKQRLSEQSQGIAISMVVDISTSMDFYMEIDGDKKPRMEVAKKALMQFVLGDNDKLTGRPNDLISVITFARYPDTLVPLTNAHDALVDMTNAITTSTRPNEDGTAFGDATALAAAQLNHYETSLGLENDTIKSKVIILLTDGENNSGSYDPLMAAAMAEQWGIKIYTISIGDNDTSSLVNDEGKTIQFQQTIVSTDWTLQAMAQSTGGVFQKAHNFESLHKIYQSINELETSSLQRVIFEDKQAVFHWPVLLSLLFIFLANIANATWLRKQT